MKDDVRRRRTPLLVVLSLLAVAVAVGAFVVFNGEDADRPGPVQGGAQEAPAPEGRPLTVSGQGQSVLDGGERLTYAIVLANGSDLIAQETRVDIQALDAAGAAMEGATWVIVVQRVLAHGTMAYGDQIRPGAVPWPIGEVASLRVTVRDTQTWWRDDGSITAAMTPNPKATFSVEDARADTRKITVQTTSPGSAMYTADLTLVLKAGDGRILGACRVPGMVTGVASRWVAQECHVPEGWDENAIDFYIDAPWNDPRLPTPYPTES